jgi:hypothetical protein
MKNTEKGEMPVPYIIALILGVIVLVLIVYALFSGWFDVNKIFRERGCETKKMGFCSDLKAGNSPKTFSMDCTGSNSLSNPDNYYAPECCSVEGYNHDFSPSDCGVV